MEGGMDFGGRSAFYNSHKYCDHIQLFHMGRIPRGITFQYFREPQASCGKYKLPKSTEIYIDIHFQNKESLHILQVNN